MSKKLGLREQVKSGKISIDEAIELAKNYNETIREWLLRRKSGNVKPSTKAKKPVKKKKKKKKQQRRKN